MNQATVLIDEWPYEWPVDESLPIFNIRFKKLDPEAIPFSYSRECDACMDMYALNSGYLLAGETYVVQTGIAVEIPKEFEGIVRGRSGLSSKGLIVPLGTIDEEYRGDVGIIITNCSNDNFYFKKGERLAQFTIKPVYRIKLQEVEELNSTDRNTDGFGSSGL